MVSTWTAEATSSRLVIRNPGGSVVYTYRGSDLDGSDHGVNLDAADSIAERAGYVTGRFRWQESGGYFKAVATPESAFPKRKPQYTDAEMEAWRRSPEGQAVARMRARR